MHTHMYCAVRCVCYVRIFFSFAISVFFVSLLFHSIFAVRDVFVVVILYFIVPPRSQMNIRVVVILIQAKTKRACIFSYSIKLTNTNATIVAATISSQTHTHTQSFNVCILLLSLLLQLQPLTLVPFFLFAQKALSLQCQ